MNLTPQEKALYERHLTNLTGPGGVDNPDGSRSTLYQATVEHDGKVYAIPTVWGGKILPADKAVDRVRQEGWDKFPAYKTEAEAEARYNQMHGYMEKDTSTFLRGRDLKTHLTLDDSRNLKWVKDVEFHPNQLRQIESDNVEDRRNDPDFNDPRPVRIINADEAEMTADYFFRSIVPPSKMAIEAGHTDVDKAVKDAREFGEQVRAIRKRNEQEDTQRILDSMRKKR